ncbi:unnamed protein product [Rotaria socialis]|uniref:Uncharacterized protein n=1 Tax=Rotaria socialis TaxID=392032 RepID=A0A818WP27_9BILA|nr:unnamed protein product [Rotaria socialis]CAF4900810.1 unnamed protein product [Rotaria socialis]
MVDVQSIVPLRLKTGLTASITPDQIKKAEKDLSNYGIVWLMDSSQRNNARFMQKEIQHSIGLHNRVKTLNTFNDITQCNNYLGQASRSRTLIVVVTQEQRLLDNIQATLNSYAHVIFVYQFGCEMPWIRSQQYLFADEDRSLFDSLPPEALNTPIDALALTPRAIVLEYLFTEMLLQLLPTPQSKEDFVIFCENFHADNQQCGEKILKLITCYKPENAIYWFTKPDCFLSRIVGIVCGSYDLNRMFQMRFFLSDLYRQLKNVHKEQIRNFIPNFVHVYRGKSITEEELNCLVPENYCVTRGFLSMSRALSVANAFSGDDQSTGNKVSVILDIEIDVKLAREKPIAFIGHLSAVEHEDEVVFSAGIVLRVVSREEIRERLWSIKMVTGADEVEIEENLSRYHLIAQTSTQTMSAGMIAILESIDQRHAAVGSIKSSYINILKHESTVQTSDNFDQLDFGNDVHENDVHLLRDSARSIFSGSQTHNVSIPTAVTIFAAAIIVAVIVAIVAAILIVSNSPPQTSPSIICPRITCSAFSSVQNPSPNYQVEHLDFNCSESLSNMTIIQVVQRNYNETPAQQYQTFWNYSTNMGYVQNPTQIIYTWSSVPGMIIAAASFPNFVEAKYYYTSGAARLTSSDTWQIFIQSICADTMYLFGNY